MRQTKRNGGFTLIEVSLAIVVGLLVVAGAVVLFNQGRASAQNSAAKEKLLAVSMLVEEIEQRNQALPNLSQLRTAWKTKRPDDYDKSPWGGTLTGNWIDGKDTVGVNQEIGNGAGGTPHPGTSHADVGRIYYFRRDPAVSGRPYIWLDQLDQYAPDDDHSIDRVTDYGVTFLGTDGTQWYFVEGRGKTNTAGSPLATEGQIGS
ncbi:MAG TPA: type II secretion system protein [Stenomitos sp.]